jgi:DNA-binding Xre family transcriptional regulator
MKIGITNNITIRTNTHQSTWGKLAEDSIYFSLPTAEDMRELESIIKRLLRNHKEECKCLPNKDGYSEFFPVEYYEYITQFITNNYISKTGKILHLNPIDIPKTDIETKSAEMEMGTLFKYLRLQRDISQIELASQIGIALNTIKNLESGKSITLQNFMKILKFYGYTDWLTTLQNKVELCNLYIGTNSEIRQRTARK